MQTRVLAPVLSVLLVALLVATRGETVMGQGGAASADFMKARAAFLAAGDKGDKAAYAKFLADDVTWIDISGGLRDRAALIADVSPSSGAPAPPNPIEAFSYPGGVVITGHRPQNNSRFVQLWVKQGTDWLLVAHQAAPDGGQTPSPGQAAAKAPPSSGAMADRDAVWKNIDALAVVGQKGDAAAFPRLVTDHFFAVGNAGVLRNKKAREQQLRESGPGPSPVVPQDISIRIHGSIAVTTDRSGTRADGSPYPPSRRTVVSVKEGGEWREAASVVTLIVPAK